MKIKILGTAAATAMPLPFCNCEVCKTVRRAVQASGKIGGKDYRKRSAALIDDVLLIDLSPDLGTMAAMHQIDTGRIRYLLQTHSHSDHFDAGHFVTRWSAYAAKELTPLEIVCSEKTFQDMNRWVQYNEPEIDLYSQTWQQDMKFSVHLLKEFEQLQLGEYKITALDSKHDERVQAYIYLIEKRGKSILYGTDLLEIKPEVWDFLNGKRLDAVFLDQTYGAGFNAGGHLDAGQVREIVQKMRKLDIVDEKSTIYATHISHEGNNVHEVMEKEAGAYGYHIAYDGLEIEMNEKRRIQK